MKKLVVLALVLSATAVFGFSVVSGQSDNKVLVAGRVTAWAE